MYSVQRQTKDRIIEFDGGNQFLVWGEKHILVCTKISMSIFKFRGYPWKMILALERPIQEPGMFVFLDCIMGRLGASTDGTGHRDSILCFNIACFPKHFLGCEWNATAVV